VSGQERWEEVSLVERGGNYGWNVKEGTHCFDAEAVAPFADAPSCPDRVTSGIRQGDRLVDPVIEYANSKQAGGGIGRTVVGGYVYRGNDVRQLRGRYVFGDYTRDFTIPTGNGSVMAAEPRGRGGLWRFEELAFDTPNGRINHFLKGFGQDEDGEVYLMVSNTTSPFGTLGKVLKLARDKDRDRDDDRDDKEDDKDRDDDRKD
jgi:hypothetical protein